MSGQKTMSTARTKVPTSSMRSIEPTGELGYQKSPAKEHRTVTRITSMLELIAASSDGQRLAELAHTLDAPRSSVHGLLKGLVATGYLVEERGIYTLGPAVGALLNPSRPSLTTAARRSLEEIERQCHESVVLCSLVGESVVYIDLVESREMIRYSSPLRQRRPLYPTSAGKCFLAHFSESKRRLFLAEHIADPEKRLEIGAELEQIRQTGVSYNWGQTYPDVYSVAAPVIVGARAVASIAVAGPQARMADKMETVVAILTDEAQALASRLT